MTARQENDRPSHQLQHDLERHIIRHTGRRVRDLRVEVRPEGVVLHGRAGSYYVKQLAQHGVCRLVPGVRLDNAITVDGAEPATGEGPRGTPAPLAGG